MTRRLTTNQRYARASLEHTRGQLVDPDAHPTKSARTCPTCSDETIRHDPDVGRPPRCPRCRDTQWIDAPLADNSPGIARCPDCHPSSKIERVETERKAAKTRTCQECEGVGRIPMPSYMPGENEWVPCPKCNPKADR